MGLRGLGAKPVEPAKPKTRRRKRPDWNRKGLTRAQRVILFIEGLTVTSGMHAGKKFRVREWQRKIIRDLYRTDDAGVRVVRSGLITLGRKNGKTALAAALALAHLVGPESEPRGCILSAAADRNQAALVFRELEAFVIADPELSARCNIQRFAKRIEDTVTGSVYEALSSDARKAHGLSPSFCVCDEVSQWNGRELYDNIISGTGARAEPLVLSISTMSSDPKSLMSELVRYGEQVRDGVVEDPATSAHIFTVPMEMDPWDEKNWYLANPALGDFRSLDDVRQYAAKAKRIPAMESVFRCLFLNQPVALDKRWMPPAEWEACAQEYTADDLAGRPCYGGLDLGSVDDLCSLALFFPEDAGRLLSFSWCPQDRLAQKEATGRVPYTSWARTGIIEATPGRATNKRKIALRLAEFATQFDIRAIGFDRWGMPELERVLEEEGIVLPLRPFGLGFKEQGPAMRAFEERVLDRRLAHNGNPLLRWAISNVTPTLDPTGALKPDKTIRHGKIDPAVAAIMAVGLAVREPAQQQYDFTRQLVLVA
jgi:phage terminase large subunit-like protein